MVAPTQLLYAIRQLNNLIDDHVITCLWGGCVIAIDDTEQKADHMIDNGEKSSDRNDCFFKDPTSSKKHAGLYKVIFVHVIKASGKKCYKSTHY